MTSNVSPLRFVIGALLFGLLIAPTPVVARASSPPLEATIGRPDRLLGQLDEFRNECNEGSRQSSAETLCAPSDLVVDPVSGRLFVADTGNHRVLSWANRHRLTSREPADLVLGQPDFTTNEACDVATYTCFEPSGLSVEHGYLYVFDVAHQRLLGFAQPLVNGATVNRVLDPTSSCNRACTPQGAAVDFRGDLFIADTANNRVVLQIQPSVGTRPGGPVGATILVTTTEDELTANGSCSIREAIRASNLGTVVDSCAAGEGLDTIVLPGGMYLLTIGGQDEDAALAGDLDVTGQVLLRGSGANNTVINANSIGQEGPPAVAGDRAIDIQAGANATIRDLTIQGGAGAQDGSGIRNRGSLEVRSSTIKGNNSGVRNVNGNGGFAGGGVANAGVMSIVDSAVTDNQAGTGGGILNTGRLRVSGTTITRNRAIGSCASFCSDASGGGIRNDGQLTITNSTISENRAIADVIIEGGGIRNAGTLDVEATTLANNTAAGGCLGNLPCIVDHGGGIVNVAPGSATLRSSLLAGNRAFDPQGQLSPNDCAGALVSRGSNILQSLQGCQLSSISPSDQIGVDPFLGPLQDNGGPTLTRNLLAGSPAIDAVQGDCPATDQRGISRPQDGNGDAVRRCDVGAVERTP
jgi:CSLREA domain-containing protein